ncbi:MAG: PPC domain-containing protein [Myxococcales bacterium]|nr:PPC domain-containing protein [Myxococcales bacterium]
MPKTTRALLAFTALICVSCGEDPDPEPEVTRCVTSQDCEEGLSCREGACVDPPYCLSIEECEVGEACVFNACVYDETVCTSDEQCEDGLVCVEGGCRPGCRVNEQCEEEEFCTESFSCERYPCSEVPCGEGYECNTETDQCDLLPCNGGCEDPLQCREEDDRCVECLDVDECDIGQACNEDGECLAVGCEEHDDCPNGTFCIDELCQRPPDCTDDDNEENDRSRDGVVLEDGVELSGLVSCPYDDDYFTIVADGNHSLTIDLTFLHEEGDVNLELFNTVGVLFARRISQDDNGHLVANLGQTGEYHIRVFQDAGTQGVDYSVVAEIGNTIEVDPDICLDDDFEPNNDEDTATRLYDGRWTGLSICTDDQDFIDFDAVEGTLVYACITPSESVGNELAMEFVRGGSVLESGHAKTMFCLEHDVVGEGEMFARVFSPDETETTYHATIDVEPGCAYIDDEFDQNGQNNRLPVGNAPDLIALDPEDLPAMFKLCPHDSDYWPIDAKIGDEFTASISFSHAQGDLQMTLHRPDGTVRSASTGTSNQESLSATANQNGVYVIRVYGNGDARGDYTYNYGITCGDTLDPNNSEETAAGITHDAEIDDLVLCDGTDDYFEFSIPNGTLAESLRVGIDYDDQYGELALDLTAPGSPFSTPGTVTPSGLEVVLSGESVVVGDSQFYQARVSGQQNVYSLSVSVQESE